MGIDVHGLNFLRHTSRKRPLGDTMTIGRQGLHVAEGMVKKILHTAPSYQHQMYCEDLLTGYFGATKVDSLDNSSYEKATHIHNMNEPLPESLYGKYDTVIDGGCLEHIYNAPQALMNCSLLCRPGGQILHILPANNFCGHGFWQFSPELFFSLYSQANGYAETEVFMANLSDTGRWYQVKEPRDGVRVNVSSSTELYALVRTVLKGKSFSHSHVQQSDYVYEWENTKVLAGLGSGSKGLREMLKNNPVTYWLLSPIYRLYLRSRTRTGLNARNPGLTVIQIKSWI
jgi:SAM-dependent methyltransferase